MRKTEMKLRSMLLLCVAGSLACTPAMAVTSDEFATDAQQQAYSLGVAMADQTRQGIGPIDAEAFVAGVRDAMTGSELAFSREEVETALVRFEELRVAEAKAEMAARAEVNRLEGDAFRQEFAGEENVTSLESGLLYQVVNQGTGELPGEDSTVTIHYRGSFVNGEEFDNSYASDTPVTFPLARVMAGFSEALTRMPAGSKWKVVIPPELGYGDQGAGPIAPGSTLVFELELISVG
jgi:FKBP-type peptidyl-prolyl cis-trans isomerase FklB